jgi:hypothetical protein
LEIKENQDGLLEPSHGGKQCEGAATIVKKYVPSYPRLSSARKRALINMAFMGEGNGRGTGFSSFKRMFAAIEREDWEGAAREALDSQWARDVQRTRSMVVALKLKVGV